jgi:hypothetical protein
MTTRVRRISAFFKARSGAFKATVGLVGPTTAIVSMLLALGLISPFGGEDAIAKSVEKTRDASTSEVAIDVRIGKPADGSAPFYYTGEGEFDHETGHGRLTLDFSDTPGMESASAVDTILRGQVVYFRGPRGEGVPSGGAWLKVDVVDVADRLEKQRLLGGDDKTSSDLRALAKVDFPDPSGVLIFLERSGDLTKQADQTIHGVDTSYYVGTVRDGTARFHLDVWIDGDDLVRQVRIRGGAEHLDFTVFFRKFDVAVDAAPPQGNVRDALELFGG